MLFTNYIKPSQVTDFARPIYRHNTQAMPLYELLRLRIIYNLVNSVESVTYTSKPSNFRQARQSNQAKLANLEIFGSIAVALILIVMWGAI